MIKIYFHFLLTALFLTAHAYSEEYPEICSETNVSEAEMFEAMDPMDSEVAFKSLCKNVDQYLLPNDHPIKSTLDRIFSASRVLASIDAMKKAGFINPKIRARKIIIGVHPQLKGYLLKVFLDKAKIDELAKFTKRIEGALLIKDAIDKFGYNHMMKVPKKWIYQLPANPAARAGSKIYPKKYVLVVEDMNIESDVRNRELYKTAITNTQLDALFNILTTCGLIDSTFVPNIPFTKDGYISFIDTEFFGKTGLIWYKIGNLVKYLSVPSQVYWKNLCKTRRPSVQLKCTSETLEDYTLETDHL